MAGVLPERLLERDEELASLASHVARSHRGLGGALAIEGPAGIGKSRLLAALRERAREEGLLVASARASELERAFAFGVVRQLLEPLLAGADAGERERWTSGAAHLARPLFDPTALDVESGDLAPTYPRLHGLYWLCANVAQERPLVLTVDDAQWADESSLSFLGFVARRLEGLPLLLALAVRTGEERSAPLASLLGDPAVDALRPVPLSLRGVSDWVRDVLREDPAPEFPAACHAATGGNPLLLKELLHEVVAEGLRPTAAHAERVEALGPSALSHVVLLRLVRLPPAARALARSAALLGDHSELRDAAALAGLDEGEARHGAAALVRADVLEDADSLTFVHPIIRSSVLDDLSGIERAQGHARAAAILHARGASAEEVATHLMCAERIREPWVLATLRTAARQARGLGDPSAAARYLQRAIDLAGFDEERAALLAELGFAEAVVGDPGAAAHLRAAIALSPDAEQRAAWAVALGDLLKFAGDGVGAFELLDDMARGLEPGSPLRRRLEVEAAGAGYISVPARSRVGDRVHDLVDPRRPARNREERMALASLAFEAAVERGEARTAIDLAQRSLAAQRIDADALEPGQAYIVATAALTFCEQLENVERLHSEALERARRDGSAIAATAILAMRAFARFRLGRVAESEADATAALELAAEVHGAVTLTPVAVAHVIYAGTERDPDGAAAEPEVELDPDLLPYSVVLHARGERLAARGRHEAAITELMGCARPAPGWGRDAPWLVPWRSSAALCLAALGEPAKARYLIDEELELVRRFRRPRALGVTLRAAGLLAGGDERLALLSESERVLAGSDARLEHARTLIELGAELRRRGERRQARATLEHGLKLAVRCESRRASDRALDELAASGLRLAASGDFGPESLTPSERRVADLAAEGRTNREIAQALFLSEKTVETHLSHAYAKLGISSRRELADVLSVGDPLAVARVPATGP